MLESPTAIENAEEIAAIPGVDVLLIGTGDLTSEMGIPGQALDERVVAAYERTIAAGAKHGKWVGMGGATSADALSKYIGMGVRMILAGNDLALLMEAAAARTKQVRGYQ